ncbi:hypothetical protein AYY19_18945 [Photobacterium aquimaris]|uniref:Uncharacterized protein n=1 Tax=Photobacterium aquimaris TaxID=512643 RepID=A0A2T3IHI0_9GAMM|nr:hypothetical protein [Photobacterium aquimaris]OBU14541.1 hypothetical protein AYY19_18945 [Photobacterium aquimaris]OBU16576.1 hypothetical protein AYY20_19605 [Photobacterium aquimaris]PSU27040.1 hypothetical protein CTM88_15465 [Photobacterium aquimaris]PSV98398.1 hypothetical protein CTM91_16155 [Photobacterium aquimaris]
MKNALLASLILLASSGAQASNSTATGPLVDCSLSNGKSDYMPVMMCEIQHQNINKNNGAL